MIEKEGLPAGRFPLAGQLLFLLVLVLVVIPPFFKGLFFYEDVWNYLTLAAPVFILAVLLSGRHGTPGLDALDYLMLALPLTYVLSSIKPVYLYLSVNETLRYFAFFFIYYMVSRLAISGRRIDTVIKALYISGLGVAAACIPFALGVSSFSGGFTGLFTSFFQYKNTLAAFLGAVLFLGLYLWKSHGEKSRWIITLANFTIMFGMRGASSRGGVLVFCAALLLMAIMVYKRRDLSFNIYLLKLTLLTQFSVPLFIGLVNLGQPEWALPVFIAAAAVMALSDYAMSARGGYEAGAGKRAAIVFTALFLVVLLLAGTVFDSTHFTGVIEKPSVEIQAGGGTDPVNFWYRLYYDLDALEMAAERPLTGWGGGGWQVAYRYYQDFLYNTKRIHNHFLEVLVESGLPGAAVFTGLWAVFAVRAARLYRKDILGSGSGHLYLFVFLSAMTLGLHGLLDFTFSFLSVLVFTGALFGITRALSGEREDGKDLGLLPKAVFIIASALVLAVSYIQIEAHSRFTRAGALAGEGAGSGAGRVYEEALHLNGWNSNYHLKYSQYLHGAGDVEGAYRHAVRAVELNPYLGHAYLNASRYASELGMFSQAVFLGRQAIKVFPYQLKWYGNLSRIYYTAGAHYLSKGSPGEAGKYFKQASGVAGEVQRLVDSIPGRKKSMWVSPPRLEIPAETYLYSGAGAYLSGSRALGEDMIAAAANHEDTWLEANIWLAVINRKDGVLHDMYLGRALEMDLEVTPLYNNIRSLAEKAYPDR